MYGLDVEAVNWFSNYLSNRLQSTRVNNATSTYKPSARGVPQGSILEPLLFIIYVNDIGKYLTESSVNLYADDTTVYVSSESYIDLILSLQIDLENWVNGWQLIAWLLMLKKLNAC